MLNDNPTLLLCCDLDRTLLPNGSHHENTGIRLAFQNALSECNCTLVYVTGRNLSLAETAIHEYALPEPDYIVADVGSSIYHRRENKQGWILQHQWQSILAESWPTQDIDRIRALIKHSYAFSEQEHQHQSSFKLSYYYAVNEIKAEVIERLKKDLNDVSIKIIVSQNTEKKQGYIDFLPANASKYEAIKFLQNELSVTNQHTVFAGDSGNDLEVMLSDIPAIIVKNSDREIQDIVQRSSKKNNYYIAQGDWLGLNGFYSAGVLEGLVYFHQHMEKEIAAAIKKYCPAVDTA